MTEAAAAELFMFSVIVVGIVASTVAIVLDLTKPIEEKKMEPKKTLKQVVIEYVNSRPGQYFSASDLEKFAQSQYPGVMAFPVARGSAARILRMERGRGTLNYAVVNRVKSQYVALPLTEVDLTQPVQ